MNKKQGITIYEIQNKLKEDGISITRTGITHFIDTYAGGAAKCVVGRDNRRLLYRNDLYIKIRQYKVAFGKMKEAYKTFKDSQKSFWTIREKLKNAKD